eukprot:TRINITY_DN17512_c0_g1_i1.p1 TRINITY_DN17512_c0_g1~~TRINITY_DN17512_c0_g1_i1.p1  ORF type:complete len:739 (+),score=159.05 TRINITY_DN17512_c0_g1_i1:68-2284(+)
MRRTATDASRQAGGETDAKTPASPRQVEGRSNGRVIAVLVLAAVGGLLWGSATPPPNTVHTATRVAVPSPPSGASSTPPWTPNPTEVPAPASSTPSQAPEPVPPTASPPTASPDRMAEAGSDFDATPANNENADPAEGSGDGSNFSGGKDDSGSGEGSDEGDLLPITVRAGAPTLEYSDPSGTEVTLGGVKYIRIRGKECEKPVYITYGSANLTQLLIEKVQKGLDYTPQNKAEVAAADAATINVLLVQKCNADPLCQAVTCGGYGNDRMCKFMLPNCQIATQAVPKPKRINGRMMRPKKPHYQSYLFLNPAKVWRSKGLFEMAKQDALRSGVEGLSYAHLLPSDVMLRSTPWIPPPEDNFLSLFPSKGDLGRAKAPEPFPNVGAWGPAGWGSTRHVLDPRTNATFRQPIAQWPPVWTHRIRARFNETGRRLILVTNATKARMAKHVIIDPYHKLIIFTIPKVGSTELLKLYDRMVGYPSYGKAAFWAEPHSPQHSMKERVDLHPFTAMQATLLLNSKAYKKILFLRDPVERLLSAYLDRVVGPDISPKYRDDTIGEAFRKRGEDPQKVTFPSFVKGLYEANFFAPSFSTGPYANRHWMNQMLIANTYRYLPLMDFIGWADGEHIKEAMTRYGVWDEFGTDWMGKGEGFFQRKQGKTVHTTNADSKIDKHYTPELREMARELYRIDYYFIKEIGLKAGGPPVDGHHLPYHIDMCTPSMQHVKGVISCVPGPKIVPPKE